MTDIRTAELVGVATMTTSSSSVPPRIFSMFANTLFRFVFVRIEPNWQTGEAVGIRLRFTRPWQALLCTIRYSQFGKPWWMSPFCGAKEREKVNESHNRK